MATANLSGMKVAILVADGFEEVEMTEPRKALHEAGAQTRIVSTVGPTVRAWRFKEWGGEYDVDVPMNEASPTNFDALHLPGGVMSPDRLRMDPRVVTFVRGFFTAGKPVSAICHAPWLIIEAGEARWRRIASWPSLRTDLRNAGAEWVDQEAVIDGNLVTARKPDDLPSFNLAMCQVFNRVLQQSKQAA